MTGIVAHTYPEWWLKLAGQVAHWSTDYSPFVFEEKTASKPFLMDLDYANDNEKVKEPRKQNASLEDSYASYCNYQIIPVSKNIYIDRSGNAIAEKESFNCKVVIDKIIYDDFEILTSDIINITTLIAKKYSYAIFNGSKREGRMIESVFREKTKMAMLRKTYVEHGWQLIEGRMQYLNDSKNGSFPFAIDTGLFMPVERGLTGKDVYIIFQKALAVYRDETVSATMVLFSLLGVSFKLFENAGYTPRFVLFINGKTGSMKTTLSKIFYTQLTDEKHRNTVRRIDSDTIVSFERALVKNGRDTTTLFDDYAPAKTSQKKAEMQNKLEAIIRMVGDGSTKSRSNERLQDVQGEGVHGTVVITGELRGKGLSSNLRCVYCMIEKSNVDVDIVSWFQKNANYYTTFISKFTEYLSLNWNDEISYIKNNFDKERAYLQRVLKERRLVDSCVTLSVLADILKRFFIDYCNINNEYIEQIINRMKEAVVLNIKLSEAVSTEENPAIEFIKVVDTLINKKNIIIGTKEEFLKIKSFDGFEDKDSIYLLPSNVIAKVAQYYRSVNRFWAMDVNEVLGMLYDEKIIRSYPNGSNKRTFLARVVVGEGRKQGFIKISKEVYSAIIDDKYEV